MEVISSHILQGCFACAIVPVRVKQSFRTGANRMIPKHNKIQQMKTLRIYFWVHRHQQLTESTVSVILCVRYMFALYTQMVVGLAVIRPVRTHVTALMDTLVTKVRGNALTAVMMATRLITGGVVHGVVLDVSSVIYKTEQEFVWW